jgi:rhodanese-related sulfurtransferase
MSKTFQQLADEAMAQANAISPQDALLELQQNTDALLVDVRDESEAQATGIGVGAISAPGRSIAWKADQDFDKRYCEPELADRKRRIITTCGCSPCYRGASAANLLTEIGFDNVVYVEGGMTELLATGLKTQSFGETEVLAYLNS